MEQLIRKSVRVDRVYLVKYRISGLREISAHLVPLINISYQYYQ